MRPARQRMIAPATVHARARPGLAYTSPDLDALDAECADIVRRAMGTASQADIAAGTGADASHASRWCDDLVRMTINLRQMLAGSRDPRSAGFVRRLHALLGARLAENAGDGLDDLNRNALLTRELLDVLRSHAEGIATGGALDGPETAAVLREMLEARDVLDVAIAELQRRVR